MFSQICIYLQYHAVQSLHLCNTSTSSLYHSDGIFALNQESFQHSQHVGKCISTKKVGSDEREDITNLYKYNEKSPEERKAFETAYSFGMGTKAWIGESVNLEEEGKDLTLGIWTRLNLSIKSSAQCK